LQHQLLREQQIEYEYGLLEMSIEQKRNLRNLAILFASALVIYFRSPSHFLAPSLWAEEGTRYFAFANNLVWYQALTKVTLGYFSLWPNLALTVAVNLFSLENVPLITTIFAFIVQLIPIIIILWSQSCFWRNDVMKGIGILVVLFAPLSEEVWLNTINSQFYCLLIAFLILIEDIDTVSMLKKWWYRILLALAGLTGAVSSFLIPLFVLKAWREKKTEYVVQTTILLLGAVVQMSALWTSSQYSDVPLRWNGFDFRLFISAIWTKSLALAFLGLENANAYASMLDNMSEYEFGLFSLLLLFPIAVFFVYHALKLQVETKITLIGSYFLVSIFMVMFSLGSDKSYLVFPGNGSRYFYVPNVILMFIVLAAIRFEKTKFKMLQSILPIALLIISLGLGMTQYFKLPTRNDLYGPNWKEEISEWRENPQKALVGISPKGWEIWLGQPLHYELTDRLALVGIYKEKTSEGLNVKLLWKGDPTAGDDNQTHYTAYVHVINGNSERLAGYDYLLGNEAHSPFFSSYHQLACPSDCFLPNYCGLVIGVYYFENEELVNVNSITLENSTATDQNAP
jgi:hypothetical protein